MTGLAVVDAADGNADDSVAGAAGLDQRLGLGFETLALEMQIGKDVAMDETVSALAVGYRVPREQAGDGRGQPVGQQADDGHADRVVEPVADDDAGLMLAGGHDERRNFGGVMLTVGIEENAGVGKGMLEVMKRGLDGCALAEVVGMADDGGANGFRDGGGVVDRPVVDDHDLVDERDGCRDDGRDTVGLVEGRDENDDRIDLHVGECTDR